MRCNCCNKEIAAGWALCAYCGFPAIGSTEGSQQEIDNVHKMAAEYRREKFKGVQVGISFYEYKEKDGELFAHTKEDVIICDLGSLQGGDVKWLDEEFAAVEKSQEVMLEAFVQYADGEKERFLYKPLLKACERATKVAVSWAEGLAVTLLVGDPAEYSEVGTVSLSLSS